MATAAICYDDQVLAGALTASSDTPNLRVANLKHPALYPQIWRSTAQPSWVQCDFGASKTIGAVALLGTNLTPVATMRIRLSAAADMSSPTYDTGAEADARIDARYRHLIHVMPAPAAGRYLRIDLTDASLGYQEAGRLVAMTAFRPSRNFKMGYRWAWLDSTQIDVSETGQMWIEAGVTRRELRFQLHALTDAEAMDGQFVDIATTGRRQDMLVVLDPGLAKPALMSIFGPAMEHLSADHPMRDLHTADLVIHERR